MREKRKKSVNGRLIRRCCLCRVCRVVGEEVAGVAGEDASVDDGEGWGGGVCLDRDEVVPVKGRLRRGGMGNGGRVQGRLGMGRGGRLEGGRNLKGGDDANGDKVDGEGEVDIQV